MVPRMSRTIVLCTTSQLAASLGVDPATVRRWAAAHRIRPAVVTPGGHYRFDLDDVSAQLAQQTDQPVDVPDPGLNLSGRPAMGPR